MIEKYKLEELLKKYNININVASNEQLLSRGEYQEIDDTLDYLINELHIDRKNIEKCPSVMYYSVDNIKKNAVFLKNSKVSFDKVEKCLHVLSTDNDELVKTYNYVLTNYGVDIINKTVSVLSIPTSRIITIENLNIPRIKKKDVITISAGRNKISDIKDILQSEEFKAHPELFTSKVLARGDLKEIKDILASEEFKNHPELFTSTVLAEGNLKEIKDILQSDEFKNHPELFTSTVLAQGNLEDIQTLLALPYWQEERYKKLLTSSIVANSKQMIIKLPIQFKMAEEYEIDDYLTTKFLLAAPSQNYAKINYLLDNDCLLVEDDKLNRIFSYQPCVLKKRFGIDLKELMNKYPFDGYKENEFTKHLSH